MILAFGTVTVFAGVETVMELGALLAEIELATESFSSALLNLTHDAEMRRQHPITELSPVVGPVQTEDVSDLDH
jgi:hypothetical protein